MKERTARGTAVVNLLPLAPDETIQALVATKDFDSGGYLMFATKKGQVKKTALAEYDKSRREGEQEPLVRLLRKVDVEIARSDGRLYVTIGGRVVEGDVEQARLT